MTIFEQLGTFECLFNLSTGNIINVITFYGKIIFMSEMVHVVMETGHNIPDKTPF